MPPHEGWRIAPEIDRNIEYLAAQTTHQLGLGMWRILKMQAAYRTFVMGKRVIDLGDRFANASRAEFFSAINARQQTAMVFCCLALHQREPG